MTDIQCDDCSEQVHRDDIERLSWVDDDLEEHATELCPECAEIHKRWYARIELERLEEGRGDHERDERKDPSY